MICQYLGECFVCKNCSKEVTFVSSPNLHMPLVYWLTYGNNPNITNKLTMIPAKSSDEPNHRYSITCWYDCYPYCNHTLLASWICRYANLMQYVSFTIKLQYLVIVFYRSHVCNLNIQFICKAYLREFPFPNAYLITISIDDLYI